MEKPIVIEVFADNGEHSHWAMINYETGEKLWSENPQECAKMGEPVVEDIDNKYWNEDEVREILDASRGTMRNYMAKGWLTDYQVGFKHFFEKKEVLDLIEAGKRRERNIKALEKYADPQFRQWEKHFIILTAKYFIKAIEAMKIDFCKTKEYDIFRRAIADNMTFAEIAEKHNLTRERTRQIFMKAVHRIKHVCVSMKKDYEENYLKVMAENNVVNEMNKMLQMQIDDLRLQVAIDPKESGHEEKKEEVKIKPKDWKLLSTPISHLGLSVRLYNCLDNFEVKTLGDIVRHREMDMLRMRNFGKKSFDEMRTLVKNHGLHFDYFNPETHKAKQ